MKGEVVTTHGAFEATIAQDGSLVVGPEETRGHGLKPGDRVQVSPVARTRIRSMRGFGAQSAGFNDDHLRDLRREMGARIGKDIAR